MINLFSKLNNQKLCDALRNTEQLRINEIEKLFQTRFSYEEIKLVVIKYRKIVHEIPPCSGKESGLDSQKNARRTTPVS